MYRSRDAESDTCRRRVRVSSVETHYSRSAQSHVVDASPRRLSVCSNHAADYCTAPTFLFLCMHETLTLTAYSLRLRGYRRFAVHWSRARDLRSCSGQDTPNKNVAQSNENVWTAKRVTKILRFLSTSQDSTRFSLQFIYNTSSSNSTDFSSSSSSHVGLQHCNNHCRRCKNHSYPGRCSEFLASYIPGLSVRCPDNIIYN